MRHKTAMLALGCALMLGAGARQFAPFHLVHAEPAAGGTFPKTPTRIRLIFSERLESSKGNVSLVASDGRTIRLTSATDPHLVDAILAPVPPLPPLPPGTYRVEWHVVAARGVSLSDSYLFTFGPGASLPPSANNSTVSVTTMDRLLARTIYNSPVRHGAELLLALALGALLWVRQRSQGTTNA